MVRKSVAASSIALFALAGCGGEDPSVRGETPYAATAALSAAGELGDGCEAVLVKDALVLATARCAALSSSVTFGGETREVTRWTIDGDRNYAVGDLDRAPAGVTPLTVAAPRVGCDYIAAGETVCIDTLASGAVLRAHGACAAREGTPLIDARGELVGVALAAECTRFFSAFEALL